MSWHFSQALEAAFWADTCSDGEPCAPWSETPTARDDSCSDRMKGTLHRSPFGTMYVPSTDARGLALLTLFRAASRAPTSAALEEKQDWTEKPADCGEKWPASLAKFDPGSRSLRTAQTSFLEDSTACSPILPRWGLMRRGHVYQLPTVERLKPGKGSGLLPTHTVGDSKAARNGTAAGRNESAGLTMTDWLYLNVGRGRLHPESAEWMMLWPEGWTDCAALETDKFQAWQREHSQCWPA